MNLPNLHTNTFNDSFVDIRKTELQMFEKLKESGVAYLHLIVSPPEKIMYVWLSLYLFKALMRDCPSRKVQRVVPQMGITETGELVEPPKKPGFYKKPFKYKIDYLVFINDSDSPQTEVRVAVELNGHDFHSSREQKRRDEKRNRFLQKHLIFPVHFPASVVQDDPHRVIKEIMKIGFIWNRRFKQISSN